MTIREAPEISIKWINKEEMETNNELAAKSEILLDGRPTGKFVEGAILDRALKFGEYYFLMVTFDLDYEDHVGMRFLNNSFSVLDSAALQWQYSTGVVRNFEIVQPNKIQFNFFDKEIWTVELFEGFRFRIPFFSEASGIWRWFSFRWHFRVRGRIEGFEKPVWWKYWERFKSRGGKS